MRTTLNLPSKHPHLTPAGPDAGLRAFIRAGCLVIGAVVLSACASRQGDGAPVRSAGVGAPGATKASAASSATPDSAPTASGPSSSSDGRPATPAAALVPERKYLADWFSGTPVTIAFDRDGSLRVEVPLEFAFAPGQSKPKPALGKVLDRVGTSLRRVRDARALVAAPADVVSNPSLKPDATLADKRGVAIRDAIVSRGVNLIRVGPLTTHPQPAVVIRLVAAPPPA
jgi:hypothetical protein